MKRIIPLLVIGFFLIWSYHIFIHDLFQLEPIIEEPYKGMITLWDCPKINMETGTKHQWIQQKIRAFERRNPGVYIDLIPKNWDNVYEFLKEDDKTQFPDIIPVNNYFNNYDLLEPLDKYFKKQEIEEFKFQAIQGVTYDKKIVAVPLGMSTNVIYINRDKFLEKGIEIPNRDKWDFERFNSILEEFRYSNEDEINEDYGFLTYIGERDYNIWSILLGEGGELINKKTGEYDFKGDKAIKGMERLMNLVGNNELMPEYFGIINKKDSWELFLKEDKIGMYAGDGDSIRILDKLYKEEEGFNFEIVNPPEGRGKLPIIISDGLRAYGIPKQNDKKKMLMCVEFLKFLTTNSNQKSLEDIGLFTVKRGIKDMYLDNQKFKDMEAALNYTYYIPYIKDWEHNYKLIIQEIRKGLIYRNNAEDIVDSIYTRIEKHGK